MLMQNAQTLSPTHPAKPVDRWAAEQNGAGTAGLDALGVRMAFARNAEIFGEGEPTSYVYKVVAGAARTYKVLDDGRRQISSFYLPGEVFGLEATETHHCSAEAVTRSVLLVIKRSALVSHAEAEHRTAHMLWALTARELQQVRTHMLVLIRSAQERVACFLLEMADRMGVTDQIELPMSRQDIADYLGLTIETISRTLTQLEGTGAIAVPTCRRILLRDRKALKRLHA
ncbi:helix-turn-helix domain-containing protein [Rhodoplanes sp. TEM]|uniref:Helix-turn-helix domain-containing protein n=1 Tax=Rhodoplanes tepidamans TaxID=200616 RepID=A0ABT5J9S2_RHOTP|nr:MULTISPECIES: helix-turn-helix domain-containing protein [Rhodoplanes]MDC7786049.1 helix-turn-helix domain-containing protein [Rhodoplanes tepidamans]MDC7983810.1 helix-turn-helix domain-containing protein [Rhodoplanes sp. TEM]MDQ0354892.1 CRP-like cAMP-binding protein [Rhodoplanes tepidamans]